MSHQFPDHLLRGYHSFMRGRYASESNRYRLLANEGQAPTTMVIACCDSRSAPETIFDCGPGELFVVRNVANMVPPYGPDEHYHGTSAALEFAIDGLNIREIVVMGHGRCGGIRAALNSDGAPLSQRNFIGKWMNLLRPKAEEVTHYSFMTPAERQRALERISIRNSIENLRTFPDIAALEKKGELTIHGAWFDISTGELWTMNPETGDFSRPEPEEERVE
jgi:carbonic anhydrase